MGCDSSRVEALAAKGIAENSIRSKDYKNAREQIFRARKVFPALEHVAGMASVCDVLCASAIELPTRGIDWYWILQLYPTVDDPTLEAQYRKLASLLGPIKGDFPGTDTALELILEAYSVLSDPVKRRAFDLKRNGGGNSVCIVASRVGCADGNGVVATGVAVGARTAMGSGSESLSPSRALKRPLHEACDGSWRSLDLEEARAINKQKTEICNGSSWFASRVLLEVDMSAHRGFKVSGEPCSSSTPPLVTSNRSMWLPKDFKAEQIWAVYSGSDVMPRLYVRVMNVASPTCVCVSFLEPHPTHDDEIQWVKDGKPYVCGIFSVGKLTSIINMKEFSHPVDCDQSSDKSFYRIFPRKGGVWAMYRNWNIRMTSNDVRAHGYRIVEILTDFSEESGIKICSLIEVKGYMTFFQRQMYENFQLTRQLSRLEMLSFSHRISAFTMVGVNNSDIPKDSWHLEPQSLPPKFKRGL